MANTFKLRGGAGITGSTTVYTAPANTTAVIVGMIISIVVDGTVSVSVVDSSAATTYILLTNAPIPAASNMAVLSNNNRLVLETGDSIVVAASSGVSVTLSIMEIT